STEPPACLWACRSPRPTRTRRAWTPSDHLVPCRRTLGAMTDAALDPTEVGLFSLKVWGYKQGEMVSLLIHLGDRLGLYRAMEGAGTLTSDQLAVATGLHERWVREWLRGNAAADL